jgi:hypothetical protein
MKGNRGKTTKLKQGDTFLSDHSSVETIGILAQNQSAHVDSNKKNQDWQWTSTEQGHELISIASHDTDRL